MRYQLPAWIMVCGSLIALGASFVALPAGQAQVTTSPAKVLRHVVLFKFKPETKSEQIREVETAFRELPTKIDVIRDFEWGTDVSVENLSKGFTHCFFVTFANEKGREIYLPHPEHEKFVSLVKPLLADVCVVDYWSQR